MKDVKIDPLPVANYLFLQSEDPVNAKRLKRKFNKKKMLHLMTNKEVENIQLEGANALYEYLIAMKRKLPKQMQVKIPKPFGFFSDSNIMLHSITTVPPPPLQWDILCLDAIVSKYHYNHENNNVYWCAANIDDTRHFVVNSNSIDNVLACLKGLKTKSWSEFLLAANQSLSMYTITQHFLSQQSKLYIQFPDTKGQQEMLQYSQKCYQSLNCDKILVNIQEQTKLLDCAMSGMSPSEQYALLPSISLICLLTKPERFFHTLHSFTKLDYPRDKLQLVVVDDTDSEKKIKHFLPEDARIKIVNISRKDKENAYVNLPAAYKYNIGVKYAEHDVIYHFSDTNHYFIDNFRSVVKSFVMSGCDAVLSCDRALISDGQSKVDVSPCLANMLYLKNFWKIDPFEEKFYDDNIVIHKWISQRKKCVRFAPFLYFSFCIGNTQSEMYSQYSILPMDLSTIVTAKTKESYMMINS